MPSIDLSMPEEIHAVAFDVFARYVEAGKQLSDKAIEEVSGELLSLSAQLQELWRAVASLSALALTLEAEGDREASARVRELIAKQAPHFRPVLEELEGEAGEGRAAAAAAFRQLLGAGGLRVAPRHDEAAPEGSVSLRSLIPNPVARPAAKRDAPRPAASPPLKPEARAPSGRLTTGQSVREPVERVANPPSPAPSGPRPPGVSRGSARSATTNPKPSAGGPPLSPGGGPQGEGPPRARPEPPASPTGSQPASPTGSPPGGRPLGAPGPRREPAPQAARALADDGPGPSAESARSTAREPSFAGRTATEDPADAKAAPESARQASERALTASGPRRPEVSTRRTQSTRAEAGAGEAPRSVDAPGRDRPPLPRARPRGPRPRGGR